MKMVLLILWHWFLWLVLVSQLSACAIGGYEAYGGIRSIDSRRVIEETIPSKASFSDRFWQLFN